MRTSRSNVRFRGAGAPNEWRGPSVLMTACGRSIAPPAARRRPDALPTFRIGAKEATLARWTFAFSQRALPHCDFARVGRKPAGWLGFRINSPGIGSSGKAAPVVAVDSWLGHR